MKGFISVGNWSFYGNLAFGDRWHRTVGARQRAEVYAFWRTKISCQFTDGFRLHRAAGAGGNGVDVENGVMALILQSEPIPVLLKRLADKRLRSAR